MDLLLLRHAQPLWSDDGVSRADPGLTDLGRRQADAAAARLGDTRFDEVLVSTARRAVETAAPIRERLDRRTRVRSAPWLHEIRTDPSWEGTPSQEVDRVFARSRDRSRDAWWDGWPGGESFRDFHRRVVTGLDDHLASHGIVRDEQGLWTVPDSAPQRILAVAHAGTNSVVLGHLLGLDPEPWEWERFASDHASIAWLRTTSIAGAAIFSLQRFSDVEHLSDDLITA
ncbi:MAG: histidine phosphatase family protein [Nitriliruptor sp.]|uniref:histidine phosphatase family protein n=1 Tax=Nitriliruptor sp. TaxID=2448056 RepID=UPI0034A0006A